MRGVAVIVVSCVACGGSSHHQPDGGVDGPAVDAPTDAPVEPVACPAAMAPRIATDGHPSGVAIGDVDHDGIPDLLVVLDNPAALDVMLGHGDGTFGAATRTLLDAASAPIAPVAADIDGDGDLDVVLALQGRATDGVLLLLNDGHGTFTVGARLPGAGPTSIAVGDVDGDGRIDIAATSATYGGGIEILLGTGGGAFGAPHSVDATMFYDAVALADLDGDHALDLVAAGDTAGPELGSGQLAVFHGNGDGTFASPFTAALGADYAQQVVVGDLNGDSVPDIVTAGWFAREETLDVQSWIGSGTGTFTQMGQVDRWPNHKSDNPPPGEFFGWYPGVPVLADLDGDGKLDVAVTSDNNDLVGLIRGTGTGDLAPTAEYAVGRKPLQVAVGDLDRDGRPDLVAVDDDRYVEVMLESDRGLRAPRSIGAAGYYQIYSTAGDVDGDGKLDFAMATSMTDQQDPWIDTITVVRAASPGWIAVPALANPEMLEYPDSEDFVLADLDGDAKPDLVQTTNRLTVGSLGVWRNNGTGTGFGPPVTYPIDPPSDLAIGDLDGDHRPELVVVTTDQTTQTTTTTVYANDGSAGFTAGTSMPSQRHVLLRDLNGDGKLDLITSGSDAKITVRLGNGDRTFQSPIDTPTGVVIGHLVVADLDGNGVPDLAADTHVWLGNGDGTFTAGGTLPAPPGDLLAIADLDHVRPLDIVGTRGAIYRTGSTTTTIEWPIVASQVFDTGEITGSVRFGVSVFVIASPCR